MCKLVVDRGGILQRRMQALPVVEDFYPLEELLLCLGSGPEGDVVDELLLEAGEEALCDGVVPAVALAAHALHGADLRQGVAVVAAGVHAAAVRVVDHARPWRSGRRRAVEGADREGSVEVLLELGVDRERSVTGDGNT